MLRVAVCDDSEEICTQLERIIYSISGALSVAVTVEVYHRGELLGEVVDVECYDVVFMDIDLVTVSGFDVCEKLRNSSVNHNVQIIFISATYPRISRLFDFDPLTFIEKPLDYDTVKKAFLKIIDVLHMGDGFFRFKSGKNNVNVPLNDILYFESSNRKVMICTRHDTISFYGSIKHVLDEVKDKNFLMVHNAFIVNVINIKRTTYTEITMANDKVVPVSQARRQETQRILTEYFNKRRF